MDLGTIYVANTKVLISCMVTAQLFCAFVFAYAKSRFSHDAAHMVAISKIVVIQVIVQNEEKHVSSMMIFCFKTGVLVTCISNDITYLSNDIV